MVRLFILIKRKGSKGFAGAIPAKKGATKARLIKDMRKRIKPGLSFKIVTSVQLKRVILKQRPRTIRRRRKIKRRVRRKVRRPRVRRRRVVRRKRRRKRR